MKRTKKLCRSSDRTEIVQDFAEFEEELNDGGFRLDDDIVIPAPQTVQGDAPYGLPRIIITHIVNENFKSFFGKVVVGPFHKSFSCVVGSNGSGKSNVVDSIMFVFGYRSSRMRSNDLRSLIHKSNNHSNIDECTVQIHFIQIQDTESGHYTIVPDSKFSVSRTISKDGTSFYKMNNNEVTFKEVTKHLRVKGVDLKYSRFLILQGEVEKISLMKSKKINENDPVGMLEYIEDIIGTDRYEKPLKKLNDKLRVFQEQTHIQLKQVKRVKGELNMLKEPMLVVVDYLKTKNEISQLNNMKLQCMKYQAEREMNQKQSEIEEFENPLIKQDEETTATQLSRCNEYDKASKQMKSDADGLTTEKCETDSTSINEALPTLNDLEKQLPDLVLQDQSNAQTVLQKLEKTVDENKALIDENNKKLTEITQQIIKFEENVRIEEVVQPPYEDVKDKQHVDLLTKANTEYLVKNTAAEQLNEDIQENEIITLPDTKNKYNTLLRREDVSNGQKERETIIIDLDNLRRNIMECENQLGNLKLEVVPDISDIPVNGTSAKGDTTSNSDSNAEDQLPTYTVEEMETFVLSRLTNSIREKTEHLNSLKPNLSIVDDFSNVRKKLLDENDELQRISEKCNQYVVWHDETMRKRISEFNAGFTVIANKVKMIYQMLAMDGDADLKLKDSLNPFSDGIQLRIRPPRRSWKTIDKLTGAEKTLASLTILFALHEYRPTPFYFMDEIDSALNEVSCCIIGQYIKMKTRMAQFIFISLRWPIYSVAPRLVGIYKVDNCTNSIAVRNQGHDRTPTRIDVIEQVHRIIDSSRQGERISDDYEDAFC